MAQPSMTSSPQGGVRLDEGVLDILIIGGGIVGSGIARDAAMRGLRVGLVEQHDFAFGSSSRSSRLLHGGLRYLAQGRIGLVREASVEKMTIARIAPHLAQPLPFIFPTFRRNGWPRWKLWVGVKIYDLLCGKANLGAAEGMGVSRALAALPQLQQEGLTGAVRYFDGLTNDARLVVDTLRSAAAHGAAVRNYTSLLSAERAGDQWECRLRDGHDGQAMTVRTRIVVNAAGAWAGQFPDSRVKLRLTKGVHLVIERSRLPVPDAVVLTEGKRILFVIPWGERLILGTTDSDYKGDTNNPSCDADDVAYVLSVTNRTFPGAALKSEDVISAWSGLRPLIADPNGKPSDISRAHQIQVGPNGWIDVAGGKLTTYRLMAEQTVDRAAELLGRCGLKCRTADEPLLGEGMAAAYSGVLPPPVARQAVEHYCQQEWVRHLDDVMIRRSSWRYYHREHLEIAGQVVEWMAAALHWPAARVAQELDRYRRMTQSLAPAWEPLPEAQDAVKVN